MQFCVVTEDACARGRRRRRKGRTALVVLALAVALGALAGGFARDVVTGPHGSGVACLYVGPGGSALQAPLVEALAACDADHPDPVSESGVGLTEASQSLVWEIPGAIEQAGDAPGDLTQSGKRAFRIECRYVRPTEPTYELYVGSEPGLVCDMVPADPFLSVGLGLVLRPEDVTSMPCHTAGPSPDRYTLSLEVGRSLACSSTR